MNQTCDDDLACDGDCVSEKLLFVLFVQLISNPLNFGIAVVSSDEEINIVGASTPNASIWTINGLVIVDLKFKCVCFDILYCL